MFRFKQFTINDEHSTMKVGTDALLLAALCPLTQTGEILDIGTGCGVVALLIAQQVNCTIDALDLDSASINEARLNFFNSPWNSRLSAINTSIQEFAKASNKKYELIVSNPPFFAKSLKGENSRRNLARHNDSLNLDELFGNAGSLISSSGKFCLILPAELRETTINTAFKYGFHLNRSTEIITKAGKLPSRMVLTFSFSSSESTMNTLTISTADDQYTSEYKNLMSPFLTIF